MLLLKLMPSIDFEDLLAQADQLRDNARVDEAVLAYKEIAEMATDKHETFFKARALHSAGLSATDSVLDQESSYYRDALTFFTAAEALYRTLDDHKMLGALFRDIASCSDNAADYSRAVTYYQKATEILEPTDYFGELAATYGQLGLHFYKLGQFKEAEAFVDRALQIFKKEPTAGYLRATTLITGAKIKFKLGQLEQSRDWAEESMSWFRADHDGHIYSQYQTQLYGLLAGIYRELGEDKQFAESYQHYWQSLKDFDPLAVKVLERDLQRLAL